MGKNMQVAKIVASATSSAWSQAYHAGTLAAVASVSAKEKEDHTSLPLVGKDLLNTFESEYFTIVHKNLAEIKKAVEVTYNKSSDTHHISFLVASAIKSTLYLVLAGNGSIFLLRKGKWGTLLTQNSDTPVILSSSGFLENGDVVVLATSSFLETISPEQLSETLANNTVQDASETLMPLLHAKPNGDAAAMFFHFDDGTDAASQPQINEIEKTEVPPNPPPVVEETKAPHEIPPDIQKNEPIFSEPLIPPKRSVSLPKISHKRKLFLTIIVVLLIVLVATSVLTIERHKEMQNQTLFQSVYPEAKQKYLDGVAIADLDEAGAHGDFTSAQQLLSPVEPKLTQGSTEQKQIVSLLSQIQTALTNSSNANAAVAQKVDPSTNPLLNFASSHTNISYFTQDTNNIYTADSTGVNQISKSSQVTKIIIANNTLWSAVGGFGMYLNNFYLLDTKGGISKFVPSGSKYTKSSYFASGVKPDLSQAVSLAIDGSVWVLDSNGTILQFTRGKQVSFTIGTLDTPLLSPTQIVTSSSMNNLYILDSGNERILVLDKTGAYQAQYVAPILKNATQLFIDEKNNIAQFLVQGSMYQITLK